MSLQPPSANGPGHSPRAPIPWANNMCPSAGFTQALAVQEVWAGSSTAPISIFLLISVAHSSPASWQRPLARQKGQCLVNEPPPHLCSSGCLVPCSHLYSYYRNQSVALRYDFHSRIDFIIPAVQYPPLSF